MLGDNVPEFEVVADNRIEGQQLPVHDVLLLLLGLLGHGGVQFDVVDEGVVEAQLVGHVLHFLVDLPVLEEGFQVPVLLLQVLGTKFLDVGHVLDAGCDDAVVVVDFQLLLHLQDREHVRQVNFRFNFNLCLFVRLVGQLVQVVDLVQQQYRFPEQLRAVRGAKPQDLLVYYPVLIVPDVVLQETLYLALGVDPAAVVGGPHAHLHLDEHYLDGNGGDFASEQVAVRSLLLVRVVVGVFGLGLLDHPIQAVHQVNQVIE